MTSIEATPITEAEAKRAEYVKGLRALADALEANPESLPLPYYGNDTRNTIYFLHADDPRASLAAATHALPCSFRKRVTDYGDGSRETFRLEGELHGLRLELVAYRDAVCERVVTGTAEVTKTVKDPEALAAVPEIEVTETIETVEWVCSPIMAAAPAQAEDAA